MIHSSKFILMANVMKVAIACLVVLALFGKFCHGHGHEDTEVTECIKGTFHKDKPSPEGPEYVECLSWKESSCCTANFTAELKKNRVEVLYNFSWDHCGNLSTECEKYIKDEECFWQCEPNLIKWHKGNGSVDRVPVCASYCDKWFDACKSDKTCVQSWFGFNYTSNVYTCPLGSECRTFSEIYKDGKGLCDTMWGTSFKYEDTENCMVMSFSGKNPNSEVTPSTEPHPTSSASSHSKRIILSFIVASLICVKI